MSAVPIGDRRSIAFALQRARDDGESARVGDAQQPDLALAQLAQMPIDRFAPQRVGKSRSNSDARASTTAERSLAAICASSSSNGDLPMSGSPSINTIAPDRSRDRASAKISSSGSGARPTSGPPIRGPVRGLSLAHDPADR